MGVGFAADLVVCVALGIDMFDCVFPTRTARFGCALVESGQLNLKHKKYALDMRPIDDKCHCSTCKSYTRSYLHHIATMEAVSSSLLSIHNVAYQVRLEASRKYEIRSNIAPLSQLRLMADIRQSITEDRFPDFIKKFMSAHYEGRKVPQWIQDALAAVNVQLDQPEVTQVAEEASLSE